MKYLLLLIFLVPVSLSAQEKYFHELKGMEDSTGTTHLFYRVLDLDTTFTFTNHIYHLNTINPTDSILFYDETLEKGDPKYLSSFHPYEGILEYSFLNNSIHKRFYTTLNIHAPPSEYHQGQKIYDWESQELAAGGDPFIHAKSAIVSSRIIISAGDFAILLNQGINPEEQCCSTLGGELQEGSEKLDFHVLSENPINNDLIAVKNDSLLIFDHELTFKNSRKTSFLNYSGSTLLTDFLFNSDNSFYIRVNRKPITRVAYAHLKHFSDLYLVHQDEEIEIQLVKEEDHFFAVTSDPSQNDLLYISDSTNILLSEDYGESFESLVEMDSLITGLYKKPGSNALFVLTTTELFEVDTSTKEISSLKKLPVFNEVETQETPTTIKLHQNYPNPFNPTTTISFELDRPSEITLTVFDALGRTVSVLVNKQRTTGLHEVSFDASQLSSGIYFYRLEAGAFSDTKRFTLIK